MTWVSAVEAASEQERTLKGKRQTMLINTAWKSAAMVALLLPLANGQTSTQEAKPISRGRVAAVVEDVVDAAGSRFRKTGFERWTAQVEVKSGLGATLVPASLAVVEWPGKLRLNTPGGASAFKPGAPAGNAKGVDLDLAEILLEDTLDGFLAAHLGDAGTRVVGRGYPDPTRPGNTVDIVSLSMPSRVEGKRGVVTKEYWFDRRTKMLVRVIHGRSGIEARASGWREFQGNQFPATITVYENKAVKYVVSLVPVGLEAERKDGIFDGIN